MRAGVADGEYEITYVDLIRIADFNPGQVLRPLQAQNREISPPVHCNNPGIEFTLVGKSHFDMRIGLRPVA
jgi:hypothetical protein